VILILKLKEVKILKFLKFFKILKIFLLGKCDHLKKFKINLEKLDIIKNSKFDILKNVELDNSNKLLLKNIISGEDFGTTLEAEACCLFGEKGSSYINNYSLRDAKDLIKRFNNIDK